MTRIFSSGFELTSVPPGGIECPACGQVHTGASAQELQANIGAVSPLSDAIRLLRANMETGPGATAHDEATKLVCNFAEVAAGRMRVRVNAMVAELLSEQEPLGRDAERVLNANYSRLIARDHPKAPFTQTTPTGLDPILGDTSQLVEGPYMTVAGLIAKLQGLDPGLFVYTNDNEYGEEAADTVRVDTRLSRVVIE